MKVPTVLKMLYPSAWLDEVAVNDPQQRTNHQVQAEVTPLITSYDYIYPPQHSCIFGASYSARNSASLVRPFNSPSLSGNSPSQTGHISQLGAALTHHVSADKLRRISKSIPKVVILCGDEDSLVDLRHSRDLKACMPEAEFVQWKNTGHGIHSQRPAEFHNLLMRIFGESNAVQTGAVAE